MDNYNYSDRSKHKLIDCYISIRFDELSENEKCETFVQMYALMKSIPGSIRSNRKILLESATLFQGDESSEIIRKIAKKILQKVNEVQEEAALFSIPDSYKTLHTHANISFSDYMLLLSESQPGDAVSQSKGIVKKINKIKRRLSRNNPDLFAEFESYQNALKMRSKERENIETFKSTINSALIVTDTSRADELIGMKREEILPLYKEKISFLKGLMQNSTKKTKRIAIVGAGPAGLCRALVAIINGYTVTILEKREDPRTKSAGRSNILHLGHDTPSDIDFLLQYGVFESMILSKVMTKSPYGGFEVSIEDLEKHMALLVEEFQPGALVSSAVDLKITPHFGARAALSFGGGSILADLVILAEGAKSTITKSLGMTYQAFTKKSLAPVGFFERDNSLGADLIHTISTLYAIGKELTPNIVHEGFLKVKQKLYSKGILFRNDKRDYVGIALNNDEEEHINSLSSEEQDLYIKEILIQRHKEIDAALAFFFPNTALPRAAILKEHKIIPIQVKKSETPLFTAGNTLFLVRGDAHGTTNPASGYGAKTALSSYLADLELLSLYEWTGINRFITTSFIESANLSLSGSQKMGMVVTNTYRTLFEKIDFYLDLENESRAFPEMDFAEIVYFLAKTKYSSLTDKEKSRVEDIRKELIQQFQRRYIIKSYSSCIFPYAPKAFRTFLAEKKIPPEEIDQLVSAIDPYHDRSKSFEEDFRRSAIRYFSSYINPERPFVVFMGILGFIDKILFYKPDLK